MEVAGVDNKGERILRITDKGREFLDRHKRRQEQQA
jgi:predicted transcriptional regulator